jgi:hypothetical protein
MTLASNAKTMDPAAATVVRRTVLRIAPLEVDSRFEELLPEGGKVRLGEIDPAWGESYAVSNAVADIASFWGRVGAADPGRYEEALKRARTAASATSMAFTEFSSITGRLSFFGQLAFNDLRGIRFL